MFFESKASRDAKRIFDTFLRTYAIKSPQDIINYAREFAAKNLGGNRRNCYLFAHEFLNYTPQSKREVEDIFANLPKVINPPNISLNAGFSPFEIRYFLGQLIGGNTEYFYLKSGEQHRLFEYYENQSPV